MATLPARCPTPPHLAAPVDRCACALLACLDEYALRTAPSTLGPSTSEADLGHRSDAASEHDRETRRLVALLTTRLSAPGAPRLAGPAPAALTRREIEVLDAVADGLSTSEIAAVLHISVNTARNHVQRILEKFGVHTRLQAVNLAVRHGLLQRLAGS